MTSWPIFSSSDNEARVFSTQRVASRSGVVAATETQRKAATEAQRAQRNTPWRGHRGTETTEESVPGAEDTEEHRGRLTSDCGIGVYLATAGDIAAWPLPLVP